MRFARRGRGARHHAVRTVIDPIISMHFIAVDLAAVGLWAYRIYAEPAVHLGVAGQTDEDGGDSPTLNVRRDRVTVGRLLQGGAAGRHMKPKSHKHLDTHLDTISIGSLSGTKKK